jgi:flagellum-specific peptidoglycan hydrolase FlgJ
VTLPSYAAQFLFSTAQAAADAKHPFPEYAASEAALESGYGHSALAHDACNLFGTKQHVHPIYGTLSIPTKEFLSGEWTVVEANWVVYPTIATCFSDRLNTLERLRFAYPHYAAALNAANGETFVREVSRSWSTDPKRADKVLAIYDAWHPSASGVGQLGPIPPVDPVLAELLKTPTAKVSGPSDPVND